MDQAVTGQAHVCVYDTSYPVIRMTLIRMTPLRQQAALRQPPAPVRVQAIKPFDGLVIVQVTVPLICSE